MAVNEAPTLQDAGQFPDVPAGLPATRPLLITCAIMVAFLLGMVMVWYLKDLGMGGRWLALWDMESMAVFTCAGLFVGFTALHPAYGLAVLTFLRPWLDGMTYPGDNLYFLAGILVLTVMWALRTLLRGGGMRHCLPAGLLFGYVALALVMLPAAYQIDFTVQQILLWTGYLGLFLLVSNGLRARGAALAVLGGLLASALFEAIYAIIHFQFTLDFVRMMMKENPEALKPLFNVDVITPEVIRRLNINRAFGTMLQPNSLAAFMILALPTALGGLVYCARRSTEAALAWREAGQPSAHFMSPVAMTAAGVFVAAMFATGVYAMLSTSLAPGPADFTWVLLTALITSVVIAFIFALLVRGHAKRHGARAAAYAAGAFGCLATAPVLAWALWLSYSRGALLALAMAAVLVGVLLLARGRWGRSRLHRAAAVLLCAGAALGALGVSGDPAAPVSNTGALPASTSGGPAGSGQALEVKGVDVTAEALLDPSSLRIRLTYWRVGVRMGLDNLWTGVGLGNFGTAYPKYQDMRAGDVKTAHNALVKAFAETGLPGLAVFCLFWFVVLIHGARLVWCEGDAANRMLCAGLLAGILAFLGHALLDFHFAHPSLMFFLMVVCGLLYTRAYDRDAALHAPGLGRQIPLLVILVGCALAAGVGYRVYAQHYGFTGTRMNLSGEERLEHNRTLATESLYRTSDYGRALRKALREKVPVQVPRPRIPWGVLQPFIAPAFQVAGHTGPERELLDQLGTFAEETAERSWRAIGPEEPLPPGAWYFIDKKPFLFTDIIVKACESWVAEVEDIDRLFPYRPDIAAYIAQFYELMEGFAARQTYPEDYARYQRERLRWTEEAVLRSPERHEFRSLYGQLLWQRGEAVAPSERRPYFEKAIEQYRIAQRLAPEILPMVNFNLSGVLRQYGNALIDAGEAERGNRLLEEAANYKAQGERIYAVRGEIGFL
jgi:O-antigen ligase